MQTGRGLYIVCTRLAPTDLPLVGWLRLRACIIAFASASTKTGSLVFRASTDATKQGSPISASSICSKARGAANQEKVDNGELSRIDPSRQIVPGPTRNIHPVSTRQSPCRDRQTQQSCTATKRLKK
jgi:hypothetical protein